MENNQILENEETTETVDTFAEELKAKEDELAQKEAEIAALRDQNSRILKDLRRAAVPKAGAEEEPDEYAFLDKLKIKS